MRPVVLGMNDPHSDDPALALHPSARPGSAGVRLFQMVRDADPTMCEREYVSRLERRNLVVEGDWSKHRARETAVQVTADLAGAHVVMLGSLVPGALRLRHLGGWYAWQDADLFRYCVVPHPSGLNRVYNDVSYRERTGRLLADLVRGQRP